MSDKARATPICGAPSSVEGHWCQLPQGHTGNHLMMTVPVDDLRPAKIERNAVLELLAKGPATKGVLAEHFAIRDKTRLHRLEKLLRGLREVGVIAYSRKHGWKLP